MLEHVTSVRQFDTADDLCAVFGTLSLAASGSTVDPGASVSGRLSGRQTLARGSTAEIAASSLDRRRLRFHAHIEAAPFVRVRGFDCQHILLAQVVDDT